MKKYSSNEATINYIEKNAEKPHCLLFIHGNSHSSKTFRNQLDAKIFDKYRLVVVDLPGHGESSRLSNYSVNNMAKHIANLVIDLKLSNLVIIGHSLGGHVAINLLSQEITPAGLFLFGTPPLKNSFDPSAFTINTKTGALTSTNATIEEIEAYMGEMNYQGLDKELAIADYQKTDAIVRTGILTDIISNIHLDEINQLQTFPGQVMFLLASKERLINNSYIRQVCFGEESDYLLEEIDSGHSPHIEKASEFNSILSEFCNNISEKKKVLKMSKEINSSIAVLFKSTRRFHRLQQTEFSAILGVTQGTISKIEASSMSPELGLWFKFLRAFNVQDPYCFTYYGVEYDESAFEILKTNGSSLAPGFDFKKGNYIFNVRKIRPLFDFLMKSHTKNFEAFLKEKGISKEIFYILNHPLTTEFADTFFSFLEDNKINEKSVALLDLNFEHSLGRQMKDLASSDSSEALFNIINSDSDHLLDYEFSGTKGEYFINLKKKNLGFLKTLEKSDLIMNYGMLYPYHILKSTKGMKMVAPKIQEVKKDQRWQVVYA
jgi:DNA-binding XRE family transcriptional regulator/esterase/lipase